jgi:predicted aspartyl protease
MKTKVSGLTRPNLWNALSQALFLLVVLLMHGTTLAQDDVPVLKANSKTVDVQDGDKLLKGGWAIDPTVELDVYDARRSSKERRVTFITDVDSMSFDVQPGRTYDFIILLNGAEACRTRISTMKQPYRRDVPNGEGTPDTIPFTRQNERIHVTARINDSEPLELMFDTGADIVALRPSALSKGAKIALDGSGLNYGFGGATMRQTSRDNRLQVAGLTWDHEPILYFDQQGNESSDGILGYNVFDGKVVEIDYDHSVMIIHDSVPAKADRYAKFPMRFDGALPTVETTINTGRKKYQGWFIIDTGATASLQLKQDFAKAHSLYGAMETIGSSTSRGVGSGKVRNEVVLLPELAFGAFILHNVPTHLEVPSAEVSVSSGCLLGMDVLKRFNTILDYQRNEVYLKPNTFMSAPFQTRFSSPVTTILVAVAVVSFASLAGLVLFRARRRKRAQALSAM